MSHGFIHLRLHTEYSLSDSVVRIPELVAATAAAGMPAVAVTDQNNLFAMVKFYREALKAVEDFETAEKADEWITIHSEGRLYKVSRYCPHAGNDLLQTGEILPGGILQCGAHHYDFDLKSGRCINSECAPLKVKLLEEFGTAGGGAEEKSA